MSSPSALQRKNKLHYVVIFSTSSLVALTRPDAVSEVPWRGINKVLSNLILLLFYFTENVPFIFCSVSIKFCATSDEEHTSFFDLVTAEYCFLLLWQEAAIQVFSLLIWKCCWSFKWIRYCCSASNDVITQTFFQRSNSDWRPASLPITHVFYWFNLLTK